MSQQETAAGQEDSLSLVSLSSEQVSLLQALSSQQEMSR